MGTSIPTIELHTAYGVPNLFDSDYEYTKVVAQGQLSALAARCVRQHALCTRKADASGARCPIRC
jgi:hypothetical protein